MISSLLSLPKPEDRLLPKPLNPNLLMWSVFSREKGFYFNGYALKTDEGLVIIDPPSATPDVLDAILQLGLPIAVFLTNRDHEREAASFQEEFRIPVAIHTLDAPLLTSVSDLSVFNHKDILLGGLHVIHLEHQKSPGECVFYQPSGSLLIVGDAVIGVPSGELSMLSPEKYADPHLALQSLKQLTMINPSLSILLLGDGEPILEHAQEALELFFVKQSCSSQGF